MHEQHIEHIYQVFKKISYFDFKLSKEKCNLLMKKIKYLGHIIDKNGRIPDPARSSAIKEITSILGLANYYNVFIKSMHNLRMPQNNL